MYANGLGVVRDYIVARMGTKFGPGKFCDQTDIRNLLQRNLELLEERMTPQQIQEARSFSMPKSILGDRLARMRLEARILLWMAQVDQLHPVTCAKILCRFGNFAMPPSRSSA